VHVTNAIITSFDSDREDVSLKNVVLNSQALQQKENAGALTRDSINKN